MINRVVLVGRLTKDPVLRKTQSGASITSYTVACDRRVKTEGQPTADFINCVAWNKTADVVQQYTHKGSLVGVEGRMQTRSYDGNDGRKVFVTEVLTESVQFLDGKKQREDSYAPDTSAASNNYDTQSSYESALDISSDDLPF